MLTEEDKKSVVMISTPCKISDLFLQIYEEFGTDFLTSFMEEYKAPKHKNFTVVGLTWYGMHDIYYESDSKRLAKKKLKELKHLISELSVFVDAYIV